MCMLVYLHHIVLQVIIDQPIFIMLIDTARDGLG